MHVSGHASAGELLYCYNIVRPRNVMPMHGEVRHLIANGKLARGDGHRRPSNVILADDGVVIDVKDGQARSSAPSRATTSTSTARASGS